MLTLIQLHALHISRIPRMGGVRALRSNVNPRCRVDARFTKGKRQSEQPELLPIGTEITTIQQHPRFDV
jgi:hypothetical protein